MAPSRFGSPPNTIQDALGCGCIVLIWVLNIRIKIPFTLLTIPCKKKSERCNKHLSVEFSSQLEPASGYPNQCDTSSISVKNSSNSIIHGTHHLLFDSSPNEIYMALGRGCNIITWTPNMQI